VCVCVCVCVYVCARAWENWTAETLLSYPDLGEDRSDGTEFCTEWIFRMNSTHEIWISRIYYATGYFFKRLHRKGCSGFHDFFLFFFSFSFFPRLGIRRGNVSMIGSRLVCVPSIRVICFWNGNNIGERYAAPCRAVLNSVFSHSDSRPTLPDCSRDDDS